MKELNQLILQLRLQINQQVATTQQVEFGKGRVNNDVLLCKDHHLPNFVAHPQATRVLHEKAAQTFGRHLGLNAAGIHARAPGGNGGFVQVRGKYLERVALAGVHVFEGLLEDHGQRISLLAGGTTRCPGAQYAAIGVVGQQGRNDLGLEFVPDVRVPKKAGHANQQLIEQQLGLGRVFTQVTQIVRQPRQLVQAHAPLYAT